MKVYPKQLNEEQNCPGQNIRISKNGTFPQHHKCSVQKGKGSPYREDLPYDIMIEQNKKPLLCIVPIFSYVTPKGTLNGGKQKGSCARFCILFRSRVVWFQSNYLLCFYGCIWETDFQPTQSKLDHIFHIQLPCLWLVSRCPKAISNSAKGF